MLARLSLPRRLVIVLVIVLVIGVVGSSVSFARSGEQGQNEQQRESELRDGDIAAFLRRLAPPSEPVLLEAASAACLQPDGNLQFAGACVISIPATEALRRELSLALVSGVMSMQVTTTTSGGRVTPSGTETVTAGSDDTSIVLARGDSAVITLGCPFSCTVLVNP